MDEAQFEEIAERYRDNLFAIAFQYTKNAADADDMVQIALLKCRLKTNSISGTG